MKRLILLLAVLILLCAASCVPESAPVQEPVVIAAAEATLSPAAAAVPPVQEAAPAQDIPSEQPSVTDQSAPAAQNAVPAAYQAIIAEYADAVSRNYYADVDAASRDVAFGPHIATEWKIAPSPVCYALVDVNGDGTLELIIGAGTDDAYLINYDLWCMAGDTAVRPFDMDFGYRVNFCVFNDGSIEVGWSNSAFDGGIDFYRLSGAVPEPIGALVLTVSADDPNAVQYTDQGEAIDSDTYGERLTQYESAGLLPLDWVPITAA